MSSLLFGVVVPIPTNPVEPWNARALVHDAEFDLLWKKRLL